MDYMAWQGYVLDGIIWKNMQKPPSFYKVIITAPDGRFGTKILEGGLTKETAKHEAKSYKDNGMIVKIIPEQRPVCPKCGSNKIVDRKNWTGQESVGYTLCIACGHKFDEFRN